MWLQGNLWGGLGTAGFLSRVLGSGVAKPLSGATELSHCKTLERGELSRMKVPFRPGQRAFSVENVGISCFCEVVLDKTLISSGTAFSFGWGGAALPYV